MSLHYCAIANRRKVVCHYPTERTDYLDIARTALSQYGTEMQDEEASFNILNYTLHMLVRNGRFFFALTGQDAQRQKCVVFLRQVEERFSNDISLVQRAGNCDELQLQYDYGNILQREMNVFPQIVVNPKLVQVQSQVEEVRRQMEINLQHVLQRGTLLDQQEILAEQMAADSNVFLRSTEAVHRQARCANIRMKLCLIGVVSVILLGVLLIILWQVGAFKGKDNPSPVGTGLPFVTPPQHSIQRSDGQVPVHIREFNTGHV